METEISTGLKRKSYSFDQTKNSKRKCIEKSEINILHLSDCTLLNILEYLDASSLYSLSMTCTRFNYLVKDESLWINIDGRARSNCVGKFCWRNINKRTKRLLLSARQRSQVVLSLEILTTNRLDNLSVLALENQCIKYCKLSDFPKNLEELSFKRSFIPRHKQFFRFSESNMAKLKTLILDHCRWFNADCLTSICKYRKLEILSLYMCKKLSEDDISSISLAGKFGFKNLKVIDLRFTSIGDLFIKTFYGNLSLQVIYFQCFASTYYLERYKRLIDISRNGQKRLENSYLSDNEDNNNTSEKLLRCRFGADRLQSCNTYTIKDNTMETFNRLMKTDGRKSRPTSFLYKYPYDPCTCGFFNRSGEYSFIDPVDSEVSSDEDQYDGYTSPDNDIEKYKTIQPYSERLRVWLRNWKRISLEDRLKREIKRQTLNRCTREGGNIYFMVPSKFHLCNKYVYDTCATPDWARMQAKPGFEIQKWLHAREPRNDFEISMFENTDKHLHDRVNRRRRLFRPGCTCSNTIGEGRNTIIITRNRDGSMSHVSSNGGLINFSIETGNQIFNSVEIFIDTMIKCIEKLKTSENPHSLALDVVRDILSALDRYFRTQEDYSKLQEDECFVRYLFILLYKLSKHIKHDIRCVMKYHKTCFEELLKQIENHPTDSSKKVFLKSFFTNFLYSEGYSPCSDDHSVETAYDKKRTATEELNRPGPSGLQLPKPSTPCPNNIPSNIIGPTSIKKDPSSSCKKNTKSDSDSDSYSELTSYKILRRKSTEFAVQRFATSEDEDDDDDNEDTTNVPLRKGLRCASLDSETDDDSDENNYSGSRRYCDGNVRGLARSFPPNLLDLNNVVIQILEPRNERDTPTNIKELSLRGYPHVTNRTLTFLRDLDLDVLDVTGTNVTRAGAEEFMMYNPRCQLIHESACVCRPRLHF